MEKIYKQGFGLPGIGFKGNQGKQGIKGKGVHIGYLNDFFDTEILVVDSFYRIAKNQERYYTSLFGKSIENNDIVDIQIDELDKTNEYHFSYIYDVESYQIKYNFVYNPTLRKNISPRKSYVDTFFLPFEDIVESSLGIGDPMYLEDYCRAEYDSSSKEWRIIRGNSKTGIQYPLLKKFYVKAENENQRKFIEESLDETYQNELEWTEETKIPTEYQEREGYLQGNALKSDEGNVSIEVPTLLKSDIVEGDILYIYTNRDKFEIDHKIEYMLCITKDMIGMPIDYILSKVIETDPLVLKQFEIENIENESRIVSYNKIGISSINIGDELKDSISIYKKNLDKVSSFKDYILTVQDLRKASVSSGTSTQISPLASLIYYSNENEMKSLSFNYSNIYKIFDNYNSDAIYINASKYYKNSGSNEILTDKQRLRFSSIYLNNNTLTNLELNDVIIPLDLKLENDEFLRPLYENEINFNNMSFSLNKGDFLETLENIEEWKIGTYIISKKDGIAIEKISSDSNPLFYFPDVFTGESEKETFEFEVYLYVTRIGTSRYYSRPTYIKVEVNQKLKKILSTLVEEGYKDSEEEISTDYQDYIEVKIDSITFEGNVNDLTEDSIEAKTISIKSISDDVTIDYVYLNNQEITEDRDFLRSWIQISENPGNERNTYRSYDIKILSNLPYIVDNNGQYVEKPRVVKDYLKNYHEIDPSTGNSRLFDMIKNQTLPCTQPRKIDMNVVYHIGSVEKDDLRIAHLEISQQGFKDNREIPKICIIPYNTLLDLEKSNNIDNGILCNQLQKFYDIKIDNISTENWALYNSNILISSVISPGHVNIESLQKGYHIRNEIADICLVENIEALSKDWISLKDSIVSCNIDSSIEEIEKSEKELKESDKIEFLYENPSYYSDGLMYEIPESYYKDERIHLKVLNDNLVRWNMNKDYLASEKNSEGIYFNNKIKIKNITVSDIDNQYKIRELLEYSNPIPSYFRRNLYIENIMISYNIDGTNYDFLYKPYSFEGETKTLSEKDYEISSGIMKHIINPLSITSCPSFAEGNMYYIKNNEVKITGSAEPVKYAISSYMQDNLDLVIRNLNDRYNNTLSYFLENIVDWKSYYPEVGSLQDNLKGIKIEVKNPFEILSKSSETSDFKYISSINDEKTLSLFESEVNSKIEGLENAKMFVFKDDENESYIKKSLNLCYDASIMRPKERDGVNTFYYNDELLESSRYSQVKNSLPCFVNTDINIDYRTDNMIKSIEAWNFEYENCSYYQEGVYVEGELSKAGNGYKFLKAEADHNQYEKEEYEALDVVKSVNSNKMDFQKIVNIEKIESQENAPNDDKIFRSFLYQSSWEYPTYRKEESYIVPYLLSDLYDIREEKKLYENISNGFLNLDLDSEYKEKRNKRSLMPYNIVFGVYPRILSSTIGFSNVLMLRNPSIVNEYSQKLVKRYFSVYGEDKELEMPYKLD